MSRSQRLVSTLLVVASALLATEIGVWARKHARKDVAVAVLTRASRAPGCFDTVTVMTTGSIARDSCKLNAAGYVAPEGLNPRPYDYVVECGDTGVEAKVADCSAFELRVNIAAGDSKVGVHRTERRYFSSLAECRAERIDAERAAKASNLDSGAQQQKPTLRVRTMPCRRASGGMR